MRQIAAQCFKNTIKKKYKEKNTIKKNTIKKNIKKKTQ